MTAHAAEAPMTASRSGKSQAAFRTISEVADELDVAQHVLRFWESKFPQVRPLKRGGGRRYYRPEDIELLRDIRSLLYDEGYTIKGAQKLLRQRRAKPQAASPGKPADKPVQQQLAPPDPPATCSAVAAAEGPSAGGDAPAVPIDAPPVAADAAGAGDTDRLRRVRDELWQLRHDLAQALAAAER
jgi:DNA-binding transcriptional MerR regulator